MGLWRLAESINGKSMNAEELSEFKQLVEKQELKRARSTAFVIGLATIISLISIVYAVVQQTVAQKAQQEALRNAELSLESQRRAQVAEREAILQHQLATTAERDSGRPLSGRVSAALGAAACR